MTKSLREWLLAPWGTEPGDPFPERDPLSPRHLFSLPPTRLEYFVALATMDTGGYGVHTGGGPYLQLGLTMDQAHAWWQLRSFVDGFLYATDYEEREWMKGAIRAEIARVRALNDQRRAETGLPAVPP